MEVDEATTWGLLASPPAAAAEVGGRWEEEEEDAEEAGSRISIRGAARASRCR